MSIAKNSLHRLLIIAALMFAIGLCLQVDNVYADTISYDASAEGSDVTVTLTSDDTGGYNLTVSGTGRMKDYIDSAPDELAGKKIVSVTVGEGITYIGKNFLTTDLLGAKKLKYLTDVSFPESLVEIGAGAFYGCKGITSIVIPSNVQTIGKKAFCLDLLEADRTITIEGMDVALGRNAFGFVNPPDAEYRLTFNIYAGGLTEENVKPYAEADPVGNPYPAVINKMDVFQYDENDSTKIIKLKAKIANVVISDSARIISSDAFQNDNGKAIVSLDLNKIEKVEDYAFRGISTLKTIYAYNAALGQDGALGEGSFAQLNDVTVYYKGESVKNAFKAFGITNFVELKPFKTTAAIDVNKTVETNTEEELNLNGMFDTLYDTTLTETYSLEKDGEIVSSGDCVDHKYSFKATSAGEYTLSFKAKDSDNIESEDVYKITYTVLDNTAPYIKTSSKHGKIRALVKNQYNFDLQSVFTDDDEGDQLTYYYTRDLSREGIKTTSTFNSTIDGFSPTKVSEERPSYQQFLAEEEQIYFYALDRFGKKSDVYTVTVIPHSCSLEITADDPADLKGVTKMMIKTADDTEVEPVETVNGVAYYDLDDLESYKYVIKKKGFKNVEKEFIQNQLEDNINWKGMAYTVALEKDTNYDSAVAVDALIDAIGDIALTDESKAAIKAARDTYEALDDSAKALVEKYGKLEIAEKTLAVLQAQADLDAANDALSQAGADKQAALDAKTKAENDLAAANAALEKAKKDNQSASNEVSALKNKIAAKELTVEGFKVTSKGKKFTVKWKKNPKAEGYVVQYKLKKSKKFKTLKTVTGTKAVSKKLKKGKKYQFRVATYKTVNGEKIYGKWTNVKTVKCK